MKKRFITSIIYNLTVLILYQFIDINLFTIDFPRRVRSELFKSLRNDPSFESEIIIFDIGYADLDTVKAQLEILESLEPKYIGVNLCNIRSRSELLDNYLGQNKKIITCDCKPNSDNGTSRITTSENEVTHFLTDKDSYFELQLSDKTREFKERRNNKERINFRHKDMYYQISLSEIEFLSPEIVKDKTVIIGFLYDSLVTPVNEWYGRSGESDGDMSDAQISANIISTIKGNEFINEVSGFLRVSIVLIISLLYTGLLRLLRTKRDLLNIVVSILLFIVINGLSTALIVIAFTKNYYLNLDELTVVLLVSGIAGVYWNTKDNKAPAYNT
jgi:hypothetical protein